MDVIGAIKFSVKSTLVKELKEIRRVVYNIKEVDPRNMRLSHSIVYKITLNFYNSNARYHVLVSCIIVYATVVQYADWFNIQK